MVALVIHWAMTDAANVSKLLQYCSISTTNLKEVFLVASEGFLQIDSFECPLDELDSRLEIRINKVLGICLCVTQVDIVNISHIGFDGGHMASVVVKVPVAFC